MKVKLHNQYQVQEKEIYVKLVEYNGRVTVAVCNGQGEVIPGGLLVSIDENGLYRCSSVSSNFGFNLDPNEAYLVLNKEIL